MKLFSKSTEALNLQDVMAHPLVNLILSEAVSDDSELLSMLNGNLQDMNLERIKQEINGLIRRYKLTGLKPIK